MSASRSPASGEIPPKSERLPSARSRIPSRRLLLLAVAGLLLAGIAWWLRSSAWLRMQILRDKDLPTLEEIVRKQPQDVIAQQYLGLRCYQAHQFDKAEAAYEAAEQLSPGNGVIHYDLGLALYRTGQTRKAEEEFERASRLNDRIAGAEYMQGYLSGSLQDPETGLAKIRHATDLAPRNDKMWWGLARLYIQLNRQNEAISALKTALSLREANPEYHTALAEALIVNGTAPEALPHLQRALQIDPDYGEACAVLGSFYLNHAPGRDSLDKAESLLKRAVQRETLFPAQVYFDLGQVYMHKGQYRQALTQFEAAQRKGLQNESLFYAIATANRKAGDAKAAATNEEQFRKLSQLRLQVPTMHKRLLAHPEDAEAHLTLARAYRYLEYKQQALNHYSAYLQLRPQAGDIMKEARDYFAIVHAESTRLLPESVLPDPL